VIIVDTGPLVAISNSRDNHHERCVQLLARHPGPLLVPSSVFAETAWLVESRAGTHAELAFLDQVRAGTFTLVDLTSADLDRVRTLVEQYRDLPLGTTDASVVAIAERLNVHEIATLDHKHFSIVRPVHVPAFTLLPTPS
jgi:uncharacterized protein